MTTEQDEAGVRIEGSAWIPPVIWQIRVGGEWKAVSFAELVEHEIGYLLECEDQCQSVEEQK